MNDRLLDIQKIKSLKVVSARELYKELGFNGEFKSWFRKYKRSTDFKMNVDYFQQDINNNRGGGVVKNYLITLDMAYAICQNSYGLNKMPVMKFLASNMDKDKVEHIKKSNEKKKEKAVIPKKKEQALPVESVMQSFNYEETPVRVIDKNGVAWFVGKDVASILGYANPSKAIIDHVDDEDKMFDMMLVSDSQNGNLVKTAFINESGLYSLVLSSKLDSAKKFKRWVTSEVLPQIRKTGSYVSEREDRLARALLIADETIKEKEQKIVLLEIENDKLKEKAEYFDKLCDSGECTGIRDTAKILCVGMKELVVYLLLQGYIYRDGSRRIMPYQKHIKDGLFVVKNYVYPNGGATLRTLVTPQGLAVFKKVFCNKPTEE